MAFKMKRKGFPMYSTESALKQIPVVTKKPVVEHEISKLDQPIKHLSDEEVQIKYDQLKTDLANAKTEEEKEKLRKTFKEETIIYKRMGINP